MCMFKSGIIMKDEIFVPDYDSHTDMLEALKIADTEKNAKTLFVRAELTPKNNDVFSPVDEWDYRVDQDILPDWYVAEYEEKRMRDAVKKWAETHIHIGKDNLVINSGEGHYIKNCKNVEIRGSATVNKVCGSATVKEVCGSATVNKVCGSATVNYVYGSATVNYVYDSATVNYVYGSATVNYVYDSATVKEVYGSATVNYVCGSATVNKVYGSATVNYVYGSATVASSPYTNWNNKEKVIISENATFKDRYTKTIWQSGDWRVNIVGGENNA